MTYQNEHGNLNEGVRRNDISLENIKGRQFLIVNLKTLKRRDFVGMRRNVPIMVQNDDKPFLQALTSYIARYDGDAFVFKITRKSAWRIINDIGFWPHFLRHYKNTELVVKHGFGSQHLQKWNGWTSSRPADQYVHLNIDDLANKLIER